MPVYLLLCLRPRCRNYARTFQNSTLWGRVLKGSDVVVIGGGVSLGGALRVV